MKPRSAKRETDTASMRFTVVARGALWLLRGVMWVGLFQLCAYGQSTIVYSGFAGRPLGSTGVDFDGDGTVEFSFSATYESTGINPEFHTDTYFVTPAAHGALALDAGSIGLVGSGTSIGSSLSPVWGNASNAPCLLTIFYLVPTPLPDPNYPGGTEGWPQYGGPLAAAGGVAYLAARWQLPDGLHYGWIRLSSLGMSHPDNPFSIYFGPLVADWAYNSMPGEPIVAGAVPEPSTWALLVLGGGLIVQLRRNKSTA